MQHFFWEQIKLEEYSIYSTQDSEISGSAGIAGMIPIDLDRLWTFIPE